MDERFDTMQLPVDPDALAPDGSDVRVLLQLARGSMAHFTRPALPWRPSRPGLLAPARQDLPGLGHQAFLEHAQTVRVALQ